MAERTSPEPRPDYAAKADKADAVGSGAPVTALVRHLPLDGAAPQFAVDAGYDDLQAALGLEDIPVAILSRLPRERRGDADPDAEGATTTGRLRRESRRPVRLGSTRWQRSADRKDGSHPYPEALRAPRPLRRLVDLAARIDIGVHYKLLSGFLVGALLLLGMALLSLVIINQMDQRVRDISLLQQRVYSAQRMLYDITAQSHHRAMALLTRDDNDNTLVAKDKQDFLSNLRIVEQRSGPGLAPFFKTVTETNRSYAAAGARVVGYYQAMRRDANLASLLAQERPTSQALQARVRALETDAERQRQAALYWHLHLEHPISHVLEPEMQALIHVTTSDMSGKQAQFANLRGQLQLIVIAFSLLSVSLALLLGFILSYAFILPVRSMDNALGRIAAGDFKQWVHVPNRDEFGTLSRNLNRMSRQLVTMYDQLQGLNATLQQKVDAQVRELEQAAMLNQQATMLKRYLSPQLAESILDGSMDVSLTSKRKRLTIFYSDVRGFSALSERMEPEELVDLVNHYLTMMTEIVFKYGGTLDKYIGDAIMVFFGDPVPCEDHAERAVKMALEMRAKLAELQAYWFARQEETLAVGMGISTGYVTVGNIGSAARCEYTVYGNHVNLASRLSTQARGGQILVSERTLVALQDSELVTATEIDQIEVHGMSRPVTIFEINERKTPSRGARRKEKAQGAPREEGADIPGGIPGGIPGEMAGGIPGV